jgi:hypothetical protein
VGAAAGGVTKGGGAATLPMEGGAWPGGGGVALGHARSEGGKSGGGLGPALLERTCGGRCLYGTGAWQCCPGQPIRAWRVAA